MCEFKGADVRVQGVLGWSLVGALSTSAATWLWLPVDTQARGAEPPGVVARLAPTSPAFAVAHGALKLEARLAQAVMLAGQSTETQLLIEVSAPESSQATSAPLNVALVVDRSGSMKGARLAQALEAGRRLIAKLRDGDRVSVVSYAVTADVVLPLTLVDRESRERALRALDQITTSGDTCISCGLDKALELLKQRGFGVPHVLLLSDGEANRGLTRLQDLRDLGLRAKREGVSISSIGVDVDYDERVLSELASASDGRHHFVRDASELQAAFDKEFAELISASALDTQLVLELPPGVSVKQAYDRSVEQVGRRVTVPLGTMTQGDRKTLLLELSIEGGEPQSEARFAVGLTGTIPQGKQRSPLEQRVEVGLSFTDQPSEQSQPDALVEERLQRVRTLGALRGASSAFKQGDLRSAEAKLDDALSAVQAQASAAPDDAAAQARLSKQAADIKQTKAGFRKARGASCACAPSDIACALSCGSTKPKPVEKAAAKRAEELANPYSR